MGKKSKKQKAPVVGAFVFGKRAIKGVYSLALGLIKKALTFYAVYAIIKQTAKEFHIWQRKRKQIKSLVR